MNEEAIRDFEEFFDSKMRAELTTLQAGYPEKRSLDVDFKVLGAFNPDLADELVKKPDTYIKSAQEAIKRKAFLTPNGIAFEPHVRFFNLPEENDAFVRDLGAEHLDKLVRIQGVVSWITDIKPLIKSAQYRCVHCETQQKVVIEHGILKPPRICTNPECRRADFILQEQQSEFVNVQRAQIQEMVERVRGNAPTACVELWLEDDTTNKTVPGEKFIVTGILRLRQVKDPKGGGKSGVYAKFLEVVHLQRLEREFEEITITKDEEKEIKDLAANPRLLDMIVKSVSPSILGHDELKEAIALQLFGGTPNKVMPDGKKIRSDAHILLIGDPGTAKSSILGYVSNLAPKSVYVSGESASAVGLTASAEKDKDGEGWILKAGAMVLANGGLAIIDEFDKMGAEDRGSIHQAMEQQVISVAKAGIVTQFQSKTSVLAAANPKLGRFDPNKTPSQQFNISPPLLSRFDMIFIIRDTLDETKDRRMASHILQGHKFAAERRATEGKDFAIVPQISVDLLRKYIAYARRTVRPVLSDAASDKIRDFYVEMRKMGQKDNTFTITARHIEGIIRLSEASAKLRLSEIVEARDAELAIALKRYELNLVFTDQSTGRIDSDIISIGQPKSKLDRMRTILNIITTLEKSTELVAIDDVVKEASDTGIEENYCRGIITELLRQGDLYEKKAGHVKTSRGRI